MDIDGRVISFFNNNVDDTSNSKCGVDVKWRFYKDDKKL